MFSSAEKGAKPASLLRAKTESAPFFRKAGGEESFFGARSTGAFFQPVQPKLEVSHPSDPQEKEADTVAEHVMRMPEPAAPVEGSAPQSHASGEEDLQRKEDEKQEESAAPATQISRRAAPGSSARTRTRIYLHRHPAGGGFASAHTESDADTEVQAKSNAIARARAIHAMARGPPADDGQTSSSFEQTLSASKGGGSALPADTQQFMEGRFGADFGGVRVHTGSSAEQLNQSIHAHAFTHGSDIYFARGQYAPHTAAGGTLLAHELTHTIQQGASPATAHPVAAKRIARGATAPMPAVLENHLARGPPLLQALAQRKLIQRSWLGDAWNAVSDAVSEAAHWVEEGLEAGKRWLLGKVRDFVAAIPGYRMLCLILGQDPITGEAVPLTGANLLNAGLDLLPGGGLFRLVMNRLGIFNDVAAWLQGRIDDLSALATGIGSRFDRFWHSLSLSDVGDPQGVLNRVADLLGGTIRDIVGFVERAASDFLTMIKRVMLREISAFVRARIPHLFPLLTVALGFNPETLEAVERNGTNILNAFLEVSEAGREQRQQMLETGTFQRIAGWIDRGIAVFSRAYQLMRVAIFNIWDHVSIESLAHPIDTLTEIWNQISEPVRMVGQFLLDAAIEILRVIKEVLLRRLSAFAHGARGFPLLCVIIGRDPFTGEVVPRTIENIVKGFMSLMENGEQQYEQLKQSGAIDRIVGKVNAAVDRLNMTPQAIIQLFIDLWHSFSIHDLVHPIAAFERIVATFGQPIFRLIRFVVEIMMIVIEAVLILMGFPFDLIANIVNNARQAWDLIKQDPAGFFKNILRAIKQGFIQFFDNIGTHLLNGLVGWLMSELRDAGVPVLTDFSLGGVIRWILQVLGLSMETIWAKLAAHPRIGPERVARIRSMIDRLEGIWTFIRDVQERGIDAIWDKIQEQLSNLWDTVLDAVKNWIMERIITAVVTRLLSMLDPTGIMAVVNSAIAIYRSIQSFIRYLTQMLQVVNSFVEGILQIAQGNISHAADALENAMDRAMPIVIGFLANQVGLGGIGQRVGEMITRARQLVDQAITWLVNRAVNAGFALFDRLMAMGRSAVAALREWWTGRRTFEAESGEEHSLYFAGSGTSARLMIASDNPTPYASFISSVEVPASDANKLAAKQDALRIAGLLDQALTAANSAAPSAAASGTAAVDPAIRINDLLQQLAAATARFMPAAAGSGPSTAPVFGGLHDGFGSACRVERLAANHEYGNRPDDSDSTGGLWSTLNRRRTASGASYYIKGHLLNEQLGGPGGGNWPNLTPLSRAGNSAHFRGFETDVKVAVNGAGGEYNRNSAVRRRNTKVVSFVVTANYGGQPDRSARIAQLRDPTRPENSKATDRAKNQLLASVMAAEASVCSSLDCSATIVAPAAEAGTAIGHVQVDNRVDTNESSYNVR